MIVRTIMTTNYTRRGHGLRKLYLEFPEIIEGKISKAIMNNSLSSIKKIITENGGRIYAKYIICKLKIKEN